MKSSILHAFTPSLPVRDKTWRSMPVYLLADLAGCALQDGPEPALQGPALVPRAPDLLAGGVPDLHVLPDGRADLRHNLLMHRQALHHIHLIYLKIDKGALISHWPAAFMINKHVCSA